MIAEQTSERMVISGSPERCYAVASDVESYPEWAADIKQVSVLERDGEDRPTRVHFRAAAFGRSTSYTLDYDYSGAPRQLAWVQSAGDMTNTLDGAYRFEATGDGATEVDYHLDVELRFPLPGFVKRRAEGRIVHTALRELRARVEAQAWPA